MIPEEKFRTTLDQPMAYYGRVIDTRDRDILSIVFPFGKYRYARLPMGLATAVDEFHGVMNTIFGDLEFTFVYLDDIIIFSKTFNDHINHLRTIFKRFFKFGLKINPMKSNFFPTEVEYLGFKIDNF